MNDEGNSLARHALDLEEGAYVAQMRAARDGQGREYYLGFSQLGRHVYLFDAQFHQLLQYPPADQPHNGIMDATLLDLDDDGQLEIYIGFADPHGCQRIDLNGHRVWSNRKLPATLSLAGRTQAQPAHLLAAGEQGWVLPISATGQEGSPMTVGQRTIHQIVAADSVTPRPTPLLGMSYSIEGRLIAVGLDESLQERWAYGLPPGIFRHQVHSPLWAPLWDTNTGFWFVAGPDGSIHVIRDDGALFDHLNTGRDILGISAGLAGSTSRLYIATDGQVTAYDLQPPE